MIFETSPPRIAAKGASNGGFLITNMLTRYPELFGAPFTTLGYNFMRRAIGWTQDRGREE